MQQREVSLRVHWPEGPGPHPLIVFSHGSLCSAVAYDPLTRYWAARGYVVIVPLHLDALESPPAEGPPDLGKLLSSRIRDMSFVLDALADIEAAASGSGTIDTQRIAAAGHSFGALTALIKTGLDLRPGEYQFNDATADARFCASLSMSGVGPLPPLADNAFAHVQGPMLVTGGTLDEGNVGAGPVFPWEWRMSAYSLASDGDKYSLVLDNADHYFGGLIARNDRGGAEDHEGVAIMAAVTTTFMDAYVRNEQAALSWLQEADLNALTDGRADLEHK